MIAVYSAVYNCTKHGDFDVPLYTNGDPPAKSICPKCKEPIPLTCTTPFRPQPFPGAVTKDKIGGKK